jgi:hypothetical protein
MSPSLSDVGVEAAISVAWSIQFFFLWFCPRGGWPIPAPLLLVSMGLLTFAF